MKLSTSLKTAQAGLVSVTVTMVIMIVITLIVSSFALIVRREQQRSLDRQLSTQAFYAAEAGINDARTAISRGDISGDISSCSEFQQQTSNNNNNSQNYNSNLGNNVSYSCVLINQTPAHVQTDSLAPEDGPIVYSVNTGVNAIDKIRISWKDRDNNINFPTGTDYKLPDQGLNTPMLRVTILPGFDGTNSISSDDFKNKAQTFFLYPYSNTGSGVAGNIAYAGNITNIDPTSPDQGRFLSGQCNTGNDTDNFPLHCNVDITGLTKKSYYLVVQSLYKKATVDIAPYDLNGNALPQVNSQAVIDVTGRASDVLRRIQVRVPIGEGAQVRALGGILPLGPLATTDRICKLLSITDVDISDDCDNKKIVFPPVDPPPPDNLGDALIGGYTPVSPPSKNEPKYNFKGDFINKSRIKQLTLLSCQWIWGDGTKSEIFPASSKACQGNNGGSVSHMYPDVSDLIERTKGAQGCRKYTVKLINTFTPSSGLKPSSDTYIYEMPRGQANDPENPVTGKGICYGRFKPYTP